jgi:hypothetical protein
VSGFVWLVGGCSCLVVRSRVGCHVFGRFETLSPRLMGILYDGVYMDPHWLIDAVLEADLLLHEYRRNMVRFPFLD